MPMDLAEPLLGLTQQTFEDLAGKVQTIVHNGAYVHWVLPYEKLKPTNAGGVKEVLKLASLRMIKSVHLVSTTNVYDDETSQRSDIVYEDVKLDTVTGLSGGYTMSKWVGEKVAMLGREKGIPVNIYRPGYITGDSLNGLWNTDDFLCRLIKGCIQLKCHPFQIDSMPEAKEDLSMATPLGEKNAYIAAIDGSPVDYVSAAVINIALNTNPFVMNKAFSIVNPNPYPYKNLFERLRGFGYELHYAPYDLWRQRLNMAVETAVSMAQEGMSDENNALAPVLGQFSDSWINNLKHPLYDMTNTTTALEGTSVACPDIDSIVLQYISYLVKCKFLSLPSSDMSNKLNIDWRMIGEGIQKLTRTNRSAK